MPTLIIETGSGVENANSFATVAETRVYASDRGVILSADDDDVEAKLIKTMDYLSSLEDRFKGHRVFIPTVFPRYDVEIYNKLLASNEIPDLIKRAQMQGVMSLHAGIELIADHVAGDFITEEKVGPLTVKYSDPLNVGISSDVNTVEAILGPLFDDNSNNGLGFETVRV